MKIPRIKKFNFVRLQNCCGYVSFYSKSYDEGIAPANSHEAFLSKARMVHENVDDGKWVR